MKPQNLSAFPEPFVNHPNLSIRHTAGMTLRDYFAAKAMSALVIKTTERKLSIRSKILIYFGRNGWDVDYELSQSKIADSAFDIADEMLKKREL